MNVIWIQRILPMHLRIYREVDGLRRAMKLSEWREVAYYENAIIGVKDYRNA